MYISYYVTYGLMGVTADVFSTEHAFKLLISIKIVRIKESFMFKHVIYPAQKCQNAITFKQVFKPLDLMSAISLSGGLRLLVCSKLDEKCFPSLGFQNIRRLPDTKVKCILLDRWRLQSVALIPGAPEDTS